MTTATAVAVHVPLLDLKAQYATIRAEIEPVVKEVIESQYFIGGPKIAELEVETAKYCRTKHAIGCANGSDAIVLALQALGIKAGRRAVSNLHFLRDRGKCASAWRDSGVRRLRSSDFEHLPRIDARGVSLPQEHQGDRPRASVRSGLRP